MTRQIPTYSVSISGILDVWPWRASFALFAALATLLPMIPLGARVDVPV